ncbi:MAG TPA: flavodoxin family protein [Firmicutes bacterium]|nr:flavodoxin family protein [Bacillota bacterium]
MQTVKILGIVGSPRKNGNTAKLVKKALDAAAAVPGVETELYEMAGKDFHHCIACFRCLETGDCVFQDDLQGFVKKYLEADGVIWGAPVYHMAVPASMKAAIDRFGHCVICKYVTMGKEFPRFSKVCGVLTIGATRYGGQDMVMSFLVNSSLLMNGVVVSGDTIMGNYIGASGYTGGASAEQMTSKDVVLQDEEGLRCVTNLGKRVAEMTRIVKAGMLALRDELPPEYSYSWGELGWQD